MALSPEQARQLLAASDLVCPAERLSVAIARVAAEISAELSDACPLVLCVMRGAVVFTGHLLPQLRFPLELEYLDVTRYRDGTRGGEIAWRAFPEHAVGGRAVLVVDDILDEGHTLEAIRERLEAAGALRVAIAVLAVKDIGRPRRVRPDFVGVTLPDRYVFGFGMDVRGAWRNLPGIYALREPA